ncbi:MAG: ferredoxin family protein [Actinomycetota bacterium]
MPYIIAEPCQKNSNCVDVCPVDCIHPRRDEAQFGSAEQAYIDPAACINCGLCVPVCPVSAIFVVSDLPQAWKKYADINARHYEVNGKTYELTAKRHGH